MTLQAADCFAGKFPAEKAGHGTDIGRYGHFIVIEDNNEILVDMTGMVQALEGKTCSH